MIKLFLWQKIRVITKLPNSEQSYKGKVKTDKISQQPENCENRNDPDLVQAFLKKGNIYIFCKWTIIHVKQCPWLYIIYTKTFNKWILSKVALNIISQNNTSIHKWMWVYSIYLKNYTNFILYVTVDWPNAVIIKWIQYFFLNHVTKKGG
jgi:hypothetical protein